ncbi:hypothetical protein KC19_4G056000 [Ceratodon purpureus]|uniref:F-box domain-containing protein n=1 Tax=Ceratodon purpureus TaxID=3225 RepID=A0A8T0I605_CERPU|nr:hypothetical protein KC19_4G056000 [Ceratodon purpureus]
MTEIGVGVMATPPACKSEQSVFKEPRPVNPNSLPFFSRIVEDIIVNIFGRLEDDPRDLARLACVCRRFRGVIKTSCYKRQCMRVVPSIVSELMQSSSRQDVLVEPPGGWEALQKVLVCCPGLSHAGVLLNCWDYGLEREIGRSDDFELVRRDDLPEVGLTIEAEDVHDTTGAVNSGLDVIVNEQEKSGDDLLQILISENLQENVTNPEATSGAHSQQDMENNVDYQCGTRERKDRVDTPCSSSCSNLSSDSEADADGRKSSILGKEKEVLVGDGPIKQMKTGDIHYHGKVMKEPKYHGSYRRLDRDSAERGRSPSPRIRERRGSRSRSGSRERSGSSSGGKRGNYLERRINHEEEPHLAKGTWTLTREQGNKLLASRFRSDSLYICEWPGCTHQGERRMYKLFRGIFKNFKHSHVFRNLKDLKAKRTEIRCAFCSEETYDMVTSFCLRRSFEYHDDGEPVIRAYVCENGHVAGAWTDRPLYNL